MWDLIFLSLETVLVSVQERCMVCTWRTIDSEIILEELMVLLGDEAKVKARFGPFGDSSNLDTIWVHGLCRTYHWLENHFGRTRWNS